VPAITDQVLSSSCGLGDLRGEALNPPEDRDVVDLDPTLGQELLDVPVGEPEPQVPSDRQSDDSGGKRYPAKAELGAVWGYGSACDLIAGVSPDARPYAQCNRPMVGTEA
jgi:hypothetical protein